MLNGSVYTSGLMFHLDSSRGEILVAVFSKYQRSNQILFCKPYELVFCLDCLLLAQCEVKHFFEEI